MSAVSCEDDEQILSILEEYEKCVDCIIDKAPGPCISMQPRGHGGLLH